MAADLTLLSLCEGSTMAIDYTTPDVQYHRVRAEQERALIDRAANRAARDSHAELMRLHQMRHDSLSPGR